ncbi:hypothetical protein BJ165DRAFT_1598493 [Panaeolus papilionaceus]|nr:hypothetical protein BJ165DRAFT_1598493 [Panaeolus papilionaceus]
MWITKTIAQDASVLLSSERLTIAYNVSVLQKNDPENLVLASTQYFSCVQKKIIVNQIDDNVHSLHQHNILVDSMTDNLVEEIPNTLHASVSTTDPSESTASPPRKWVKEDTPTSRHFLAIPTLTAKNAGTWSKFIKEHSSQWPQWCREWSTTLSNAYSDCNNLEVSEEQSEQYYQDVVLCLRVPRGAQPYLRELRAIESSIYQNPRWKSAVIESDLAKALLNWSNPLGIIIWKSDFAIKLCHFHRIHDSFLYILQTWSGIEAIHQQCLGLLWSGSIALYSTPLLLQDATDCYGMLQSAT